MKLNIEDSFKNNNTRDIFIKFKTLSWYHIYLSNYVFDLNNFIILRNLKNLKPLIFWCSLRENTEQLIKFVLKSILIYLFSLFRSTLKLEKILKLPCFYYSNTWSSSLFLVQHLCTRVHLSGNSISLSSLFLRFNL